MGLVAMGGKLPAIDPGAPSARRDRRLRANEPGSLLSGPAAKRPIGLAQAYLAAGACVTGTLATVLPHPDYFNVTGLLLIQVAAAGWAVFMFLGAGRLPIWLLRLGPALATMLTTAAVILSGDAISGFALMYLWVGLYVFYFPLTPIDAALNVVWAAANYAFAIMVTPIPAGGEHVAISHFVITAGTLVTAATLLTYLRSRVERLLARLTDAARTDPLTGLPNRVALHEAVERELQRAIPHQRPVSVVVIDLDRFNRVNERLGIAAGDQIIHKVSALLEDRSRLMDVVARSGGQEFVVLLPEMEPHAAFLFAEEVLKELRQTFTKPKMGLTASAGVASFPEHAGDLAELLSASDQALRAAKALGRDRAVIYSPDVTGVIGAMSGRKSVEAQAHLATVLSLAEALDQRDSGTARHSQTVGHFCEMMAIELGMNEEHVQRVQLAGILHDIGKIGVPDSILCKPGPLTSGEMEQMKRHPELGARILSSRELDDVRGWILKHHEWPDGSGYPKGLKESQIPVEASILAVADAYEAMTSDRVYRMSIGPERARDELLRWSGRQFSERVVQAFLRALDREGASVSG
jgi:diguanylate cyclase (GGDEF)-like protein/putative nucleotidyltransferase with HDIG domain